MDIKLKKRPWYIRHKRKLIGAVAAALLIIINIYLILEPRTKFVDKEDVTIAEAKLDDFCEYLDVEGIVHPILNIKVNSLEAGYISQIKAPEGTMLKEGDTILVIDNPELVRSIETERLAWEKQQMNHRLQRYQMEQKSLTLQQQVFQAEYDIARLSKSHNLDKEEARMGIKSRAQLEVSEEEYRHNLQKSRLTLAALKHDSAINAIQSSLLDNELRSEHKRYKQTEQRLDNLIIRSPVNGQLSHISATQGQRISSGESVAQINILDDFKVQAHISEYYVERIAVGLPASVTYQEKEYSMRISRVVPEVKERTFTVELTFTGEKPDNIRVGKNYRVEIELDKPEKKLIVPRGKFYKQTGGYYIYKLNAAGNIAMRTEIVTGRQNPEHLEIIKGLEAGDNVIISDYSLFGDAEQIRFK